jgi:hypothetical protein
MKEELFELDPEHHVDLNVDKMTNSDETSFWFTMHDADGNGKLDGYELMMSLNDGVDTEDMLTFDETVATTDELLEEHDLDHE